MKTVGRRRSKNKHLPEHLYLKDGWYYFVFKGKWYALNTRDEARARTLWAELENKTKALEEKTADEILKGDGHTPFVRLASEYLKEVTMNKAISTQPDDERRMTFLVAQFGNENINITALEDVQKWRAAVKKWHQSMKSIPYEANRRLGLLQHMFACAYDWGWIHNNYMLKIKHHPEKKHKLQLTPEILFNQIYPAADEMLKRAIMMAFHFCQHENEVKKMQWSFFNLNKHTVRFMREKTQATNEEIVIDYSENHTFKAFIERTLSVKRELSPYVCCHTHCGKYSKPYASFKSPWHTALEKAGLYTEDENGKKTYLYKFKEIRHLGNTLMKDADVTVEKRRAITGHKTNQANEIYTHNMGKDSIDGQRALSAYGPKTF